jgi:hypothetical protein
LSLTSYSFCSTELVCVCFFSSTKVLWSKLSNYCFHYYHASYRKRFSTVSMKRRKKKLMLLDMQTNDKTLDILKNKRKSIIYRNMDFSITIRCCFFYSRCNCLRAECFRENAFQFVWLLFFWELHLLLCWPTHDIRSFSSPRWL